MAIFYERGLILLFVNVITKLSKSASAGGTRPAVSKDTAGM